jgi:hypothetical protein
MSMSEPPEPAAAPFEFDVPLTLPIELFPQGATVDEFKPDEPQRDAMLKALAMTRVTRDEKGELDVRFKSLGTPMSIAAEVFVVQGAAQQRVGEIRIGGLEERWFQVPCWQKPKFSGVVDVHLRPSQTAADSTQALATYWGDEIVLRNVTVDAPYDPPLNRDESLRPKVEQSLRPPKIVRGKGSRPAHALSLSLDADSPPVKMVWNVFLRANGKEVRVARWDLQPSTGGFGTATSGPDVDPIGKPTRCDVIYRPDPDWEIRTYDLTPPWGGEVVFPGVQIGTSD